MSYLDVLYDELRKPLPIRLDGLIKKREVNRYPIRSLVKLALTVDGNQVQPKSRDADLKYAIRVRSTASHRPANRPPAHYTLLKQCTPV